MAEEPRLWCKPAAGDGEHSLSRSVGIKGVHMAPALPEVGTGRIITLFYRQEMEEQEVEADQAPPRPPSRKQQRLFVRTSPYAQDSAGPSQRGIVGQSGAGP